LTHGIAGWLPFWQGTAVFFATFILEDAAAVGAGLLLAAGSISWPVAFASCFLGIWVGDIGLYALARYAGRGWFERSSWRKFSEKVERSERWFGERGTAILIASRVVPGTRLPTFLAAGFLRVPMPRFLFVTGIAAFIWTMLILYLVQLFGGEVSHWLSTYKAGGFVLLGIGLVLVIGLHLLRRAFMNFDLRRFTTRIERWGHWEFWPVWMFYPPVALYYTWLSIRYWGPLLPTAANPGIVSGGMVGESKMATLDELMTTSPDFTAKAELIAGTTFEERLASLREICTRRDIVFPYILKPDLGQRGNGVKLIRSEEQARGYLGQTSAPLLVQRFAEGPHEAGIFYYRFPGEARGQIFAITEKVFPNITGDGKNTITELIWADPRARFMADKYLSRLQARKDEVLSAGETLSLGITGNHAQGCIFRDGMEFCTPELTACVDAISQKLTGFNIGRYDIRYGNVDDLRAGTNFQIIELNGASSEATSIYDARNSLFNAYRQLFRQWALVFAIGAANRRRGCTPLGPLKFWRHLRNYHLQAATYPMAD